MINQQLQKTQEMNPIIYNILDKILCKNWNQFLLMTNMIQNARSLQNASRGVKQELTFIEGY